MIRIPFQEPITAIWKRWVRECNTATEDLLKTYKPGEPFEIANIYRRKSIKDAVYMSKDGPFKGRCAYCETHIKDYQHGDIEHFRPKKAVTSASGEPVKIRRASGVLADHPGYYWLAYNWRNLLPSCITCNQPGEEGVGKHNRFPVEGDRYASNADEILTERPMLLNPCDPNDDDPEDHLGIDLATGLLTFKNDSERARACVKIFGLNVRDQLVKDRKAAIDQIRVMYIEVLTSERPRAELLLQEIEEMERGSHSYTLARRAQSNELRRRIANTR